MKKSKVTAQYEKLTIPTYKPGKPEGLPMFFEKKPYQGASGKLYPLPYTTKISDKKTDVDYDAAVLENEYIKVEVLPEIGGKIQRALDKTTGYDFVYHNKVIKPAMVGLAGPWVSGGIEFNWPQHHRPTTFMPLESAITEEENGEKTVWVGETEPLYRMKGMAGITVAPGRSYIRAKVQLFNRTPFPQPIMWWANLAVEINKDYRAVFPPDVEWVNDHDRRAVLSWPVAKGVYNTARPFDFGEGTDIHDISSVRVPSSYLVSRGQSDADFISGYDLGKNCGIVTVADHHISPGKKLWHWGNHPFGAKWCSNLTDDGSAYVELMTGVYTDNQPDFTWVMPYETRTFDQYWYPVRDIGEVKNATIDAAVNIEARGEGKLFIGAYSTGVENNAVITVKDGDRVIFEAETNLSPEKTFAETVETEAFDKDKLSVSVISADGRVLVDYKTYIRGQKKPIEPRKPALPPEQIATTEELYINGRHLEQYRHFAYEPADYYNEALRRDPGDIRCNTAMGNICLSRGEFEKAIAYYDKATERLTMRNQNPEDTSVFYHKGLALRYLGRTDEAYEQFYRSVWSYNYMSAGYYALACIDCMRGDYDKAIEKLDCSLSVNAMNLTARTLYAELTDDEDMFRDIDYMDPLYNAESPKYEYAIDRAIEYMNAGMTEEAAALLENADNTKPMVLYYRAYIEHSPELAAEADKCSWECCFPSRLEDIAVLEYAGSPMAHYYLGCLYYDRRRYSEAVNEWEAAVAGMPGFGPAYRNLAIAYFDKLNRFGDAKAALTKALDLLPGEARVFFELIQLYKNGNAPITERLALHEKYSSLSAERDDCTLDHSIILTELGRYGDAAAVLLCHRFHTYEGGEGNLTRHHAWLHTLMGAQLIKDGKYDEAVKTLECGYTFPECYGEEKNYFFQESHLGYLLALAYEKAGDAAGMKKALESALTDHSAPTEITYFRAMAERKLGREDAARATLGTLREAGENLIKNKNVSCYYGVGSPCPAPFEYNFPKLNEIKGNLYLAYAELGEGKKAEAQARIERILEADASNFGAHAFGVIKDM